MVLGNRETLFPKVYKSDFHDWADAVPGRTSFGSFAAFTDQFKTAYSCSIKNCKDKHSLSTIPLCCLNHGACIIAEPDYSSISGNFQFHTIKLN